MHRLFAKGYYIKVLIKHSHKGEERFRFFTCLRKLSSRVLSFNGLLSSPFTLEFDLQIGNRLASLHRSMEILFYGCVANFFFFFKARRNENFLFC